MPSAHAIMSRVKKFEETGSTLNLKHRGATRSVRTEEIIERVRVALTRSPQRSACLLYTSRCV